MGRALQSLMSKFSRLSVLGCVAVVACLLVPVACMTPNKAIKESDEVGSRLATEFWRKQTGATNVFDIGRPSDALTLRIALLAVSRGEQGVVFPKLPGVGALSVSNSVLNLSFRDALCVAARNDRQYQKLKETVFADALDVDYQRFLFDTSFTGVLLALLSGDPNAKKVSGEAEPGFAHEFENGAKLAGNMALNVASLLREDWRSLGLSGDLTMAVPLMRGSGRDIVREPLTQAERDLVYSIHTFEAYRQSYAVTVASAYLGVLEYAQRLQNALDNERNLKKNARRAEMLFEAGRMQKIQADQALSDQLDASSGVISVRKTYETLLDSFKITLGLPPESKIVLDRRELDLLQRGMTHLLKSTRSAIERFPEEREACRIALENRHDLFVIRGEVDDAVRAVKVAADQLRADVVLKGTGNLDRTRETGDNGFSGNETWSSSLSADLPWNRHKERNAYKKKLIVLDQARRTLEAEEDTVKQSVRNGLRNLVAARATFEVELEAVRVAQRRVDSNSLFLLSGRSTMRDVLEAQDSLLTEQNAFCDALINWRNCDLALRRDMGVLRISDAGIWQEGD